MMAMALSPHNAVAAIAVTALLMAERYSSQFQYPAVPAWTAGAIAIVLGAAIL
jgi:zinc transporter ZupT